MHELSIALNILELAGEEAERRGGTRVEAIYLKLGALSGVDKAALLSAYEMACVQTPFANCRLLIENVPVTINCANCQGERPIRSLQCFVCALCGMPGSHIVHGRELEVYALELAADGGCA